MLNNKHNYRNLDMYLCRQIIRVYVTSGINITDEILYYKKFYNGNLLPKIL